MSRIIGVTVGTPLNPKKIFNQAALDDINAKLDQILENQGGEAPNLAGIDVTSTKEYQNITAESKGLDGFDEVIVHPIPDKYIDTTDATATADKIFDGETAYVNGKKVTGTMPSAAENEATITVESASEGSVDIKYLQMFNTYLPAGETKIGTVAEANLVPSKIKKDETIFGVTGEYEGEGGTDTSDATVTADEVIKGEVFYGADGRKTGTMPSVTENTPTLTLEGDGNGNVAIKHLQMFNTYLPAGETKIGTVSVENLSPSKIKKDEIVLGVKGEYEGTDTSDATATEDLVAYGYTFYAGGEKKAGLMPRVEGTVFSSLMLENRGEGLLDINYYANENSYIPNTKDLTRPGTIGTIVEPKFKAENIAEGVTLFGVSGKHGSTPIFDGTILIESGFTTISGSYLIDEQKAYDALVAFDGVKAYNVNFSAGGSGSGMGDSIDFTSMTFDGTYGFIKYNDKGAFAMNGGFAEYTANYGDGNGARVNFEEGTECRKEFKELFLSIADEYVEPEVQDELAGTWVFGDSYGQGSMGWSVNFTSNGNSYNEISVFGQADGVDGIQLIYGEDVVATDLFGGAPDWEAEAYKTITITSKLSEVTNGDELLTWLKANATKQ